MTRQERITLKTLVRKSGLTSAELAKRLGTTPATIVRWNQGKVDPSFRTAYRLARELGVTLEELADSLGYLEIEDEETIE